MSLFRMICRWVDLRLAGGVITDWNLLVVIGLLPAFGVAFFGQRWWMASGLFLAGWAAFVAWRAWRLFKTGLVDSDTPDLPGEK